MLARQYFHSSSPLIALSSATTVLLALPPCLLQPGNRPRHPTLRTVVLRTYESDQCLHSSNFIRKYVVTKLRLWPYHGYCSRTPPSILKVYYKSFLLLVHHTVLGSSLENFASKAFFSSVTFNPRIKSSKLYYQSFLLLVYLDSFLHQQQTIILH